MNDLQKLTNDLLDERLKAKQDAERFQHNKLIQANLSGIVWAFDLVIQRLMLLLNEQPEAITEDAHFRKHDVDGRAESESVTTTETTCADSSETAAVDGHEQTKELCPYCKAEMHPMLAVCTECREYFHS